jgi:beta-glucosidase
MHSSMPTPPEGLIQAGGPAGRAGAQTNTTAAGDYALVAALSLHEKVLLLTGADSWRTQGADLLGLRPMIMSDGPAGARGVILDERHPSTSLPCPSSLGATWDPRLVSDLAAALGAEARSKGIHVLLGPTVNLMRTPLGGRGFECFSEDPVLTARIAVGYVRGLQGAGVAATVKHYVGNDSETQRWSYDARIAERVLREVYLLAFEACVREAEAGLVMAAYNKVNGTPMTENARLLKDVLKGEWGFPGVVTSDWHAARSTTATALATLDLSMPGPGGPWGEQLVQAVADGVVTEEVLDDKIIRLLGLARRVGALRTTGHADGQDRADPMQAETMPTDSSDADAGLASDNGDPRVGAAVRLVDPALLRRATAASFVLLSNAGVLPMHEPGIRRLAVLGPGAVRPTIQGGGSAVVAPAALSTPAGALTSRLAGKAEVEVAEGCQTWVMVPAPPPGSLRDPVTGEPGLHLEFVDASGTVLRAEHRTSSALTWWDGVPPGVGWGEEGRIVLRAQFGPDLSGPYLLGAAGVGHLTITVDGETVADRPTAVPADPVEAMARPGQVGARLELQAGQEVQVRIELRPAADGEGPLALRLGIVPSLDGDAMIAAAAEAASRADAAVVVVGSAEMTESEGFDRPTLALPSRQDELVSRVAAVNPKTIVVVNSGMPVLMPWADQVAAVIQAWLPGQAMGDALADVLFGDSEPGGRLPVTLPAAEADCPVLDATPVDGVLEYSEGFLLGYRGYDASGVTPLFPFGHGLGYTSWDYEMIQALTADHQPGRDLDLRVVVRNAGSRPGREVVQAYLAGPPGDRSRPARVLAAFGIAEAAPGEQAEMLLRIPARLFAQWDEDRDAWIWPPGPFTVLIGRSSRDLRLWLPVRTA